MKKHAYLIIAHNNWQQLKKLITLLDYEYNDIFLHIDKKSTAFPKAEFEGLCTESNLVILQEVAVYWGGYSQIECELTLFKAAANYTKANYDEGYSFYHLISGSDLPIKPQREIYNFFEEHRDVSFINYNDEHAKSRDVKGRVGYYFFFEKQKSKKFIGTFLKYLDITMRMFQRMFRVNRAKHVAHQIYYGANWCSLKHDAVSCLIQHEDEIKKTYARTLCCDEVYKQTLLRNNSFATYSYDSDFTKSILRYISFPKGKANPKVLTMADYDNIMSSGALFARKFDERVDSEVIDRIYNKNIDL